MNSKSKMVYGNQKIVVVCDSLYVNKQASKVLKNFSFQMQKLRTQTFVADGQDENSMSPPEERKHNYILVNYNQNNWSIMLEIIQGS